MGSISSLSESTHSAGLRVTRRTPGLLQPAPHAGAIGVVLGAELRTEIALLGKDRPPQQRPYADGSRYEGPERRPQQRQAHSQRDQPQIERIPAHPERPPVEDPARRTARQQGRSVP